MCAIAGFVGNREYLPKSKNILVPIILVSTNITTNTVIRIE